MTKVKVQMTNETQMTQGSINKTVGGVLSFEFCHSTKVL